MLEVPAEDDCCLVEEETDWADCEPWVLEDMLVPDRVELLPIDEDEVCDVCPACVLELLAEEGIGNWPED